jgi:type IV pilus assembly protein PilV
MKQHALQNNNGFTLIEFLVAIVIITVAMLGLLETVSLSLSNNLSNKLREDAILLADQEMMAIRALDFSDIQGNSYLRKSANAFVNYSIARQVTTPLAAPAIRNVSIRVKWREKGLVKEYYLTTVVSSN